MSNNNTYDVIIIGAGSIGVPSALAMGKAGLKVLVLDKFASPGQGSNKAAIGGIRATHSDPAKIRLCQRSIEIVSSWKETYGHDIEWNNGGYVFVTYCKKDEKILKELLETQHSYGLNINWLNKDDLLELVPDLNPEGLIGGTYSPDDGHCSTLLAGHAFYEEARNAGCKFRFNEEVFKIKVHNNQVKGVKTNKGEYWAGIVVNASGAWAKEVGNLVGIDLQVNPDSHEAGITEPVAEFIYPMIVDIRTFPGSDNFYFHQLNTGQVCFCITPHPKIWGFDRRETSGFLPMVSNRMINLMPRLANIRVRRVWRGLYPMTPDESPLVGWASEVKGFLLAVGMCGQGFMIGPGLGELLARMVLQRELDKKDREVLKILSPYRMFKGKEALA